MRRERVIDRTIHRITTFSSTKHFLEAQNVPAGVSTIHENGLPIDLLISPASSDTTIFFFHGAIEPHFSLPVLSGLGISGGLEANRVFVSDPSLILDKRLMLAWYAGNLLQPDLQQVLTKIFQKIVAYLGSTKTVFFGGSGGGFASLYFAGQFRKSLALVFNPQTNIAHYLPRAVEDFTRRAFRVEEHNRDVPLSRLPRQIVTDLRDYYSSAPETTIAYVQNTNDVTHVNHHLEPFQKTVKEPTTFLLLAKPWREGHSAPPKELLTKLLDTATKSVNWQEDFQKLDFESLT